jgi:hypothetical protein
MTFDISGFTPPQMRVWEELLQGHLTERPAADVQTARLLRARLLEVTAAAGDIIPPDGWISFKKSALDALNCDGRFLDRLDSEFFWTTKMVIGDLTHKAVELDQVGGRQRPANDVVHRAWMSFQESGHPAREFLAGLSGAEGDELRGEALRRMVEFRELFPLLPDDFVRTEADMAVRLHEGRVVLRGRPDLVVGRTRARQCVLVLVDLKTGNRQRHHRQDMRFYALLATLKYGIPPFRLATYYLDEGDWEHEDVDDDVLEAAVRHVGEKLNRAALLQFRRPPEDELRLLAGPSCNWCGRNPTCPAAAEAERARLDAAP